MAARTLIASANGVRMGTLTDDKGIWSFAYAPQWLASPAAYPLSPAFALRADVFTDTSTDRPVQWFFDNLLPEEGMRTSLAREAKVDAADAWGLLAYFGRESAGALTLLADGEQETPGGLQPLPLDELERRIQAMPERALTATAPKRMSAAGAQQKLLLVLRGNAPDYALFEPVGSEPSMHLLKPDMRAAGYPHSAINEFFCMRLAKKMGLDVPDVHFLRAPSACYVIDRFDRDVASEPAGRLHTIDAMQLLNYDRGFKYQRANAQELARAIDRTSTRAHASVGVPLDRVQRGGRQCRRAPEEPVVLRRRARLLARAVLRHRQHGRVSHADAPARPSRRSLAALRADDAARECDAVRRYRRGCTRRVRPGARAQGESGRQRTAALSRTARSSRRADAR